MIPVVVFGAGRMGARHIRVISADPDVALRAVIDPDLDAARRAVAAVGSRADCLPAPEPSLNAALVVVATPASEHVVPAGWGLARGAWVLVEKPVATTITEARALADPRVRVGYSERSHPALAELAASRFSALRFERSVPGAHGDPVALDLLVHDLDLLRRLGVEVGEILRCEGGHDGLDLRIGGLRGADRIDVWMRCGRRGPPRRRLVASIGDRELEIDLTLRSESGPDPLTVQWRAFVDEARGGARRLATGAEAADDVALVQEILNRCALTS